MIDNKIICSNCKTVNPLYSLNCNNCRAFLRPKISNIDFWETTWQLFYEPTKAFTKIIQAEKKNYLLLILSLIFIKFSLSHYTIHQFVDNNNDNSITIYSSLIWGGGVSLLLIFSFSLMLFIVLKLTKTQTRYKDNIAIISYSFTPLILSFLFLTPFHIALFGLYWYTLNPMPVIIKPLVSYILYFIEVVFHLWLLVLLFFSAYVQSLKKILSIIFSLFFFIVLFVALINLPF